jgi:23S rRNA (cytidine1920-2'-O)/16S rRNA (cytidine1409-2'-O)-methyltransferase
MSTHQRADVLLVERGLFESRAKAQAAIAAGLVRADQKIVRKASENLARNAALEAEPAHPWVSRGGVKLSHALDHLGVKVLGRVCMDVGASTGGFTQVLLSRGARLVYAVDVGSGQLHPSLRDRPDVVSFEATDVRTLDASALAERPDMVTIDTSFISLRHVLPAALELTAAPGHLIALVKPQFETAGRHLKKGIVRDAAIREAVCTEITAFAASLGCRDLALIPSPIQGRDGNQEFLMGARFG